MLRPLEKHAGLAVFTGYAAKLGKGPVARGRKRTVLRRVWPSPSEGGDYTCHTRPTAGDTAIRCVTGPQHRDTPSRHRRAIALGATSSPAGACGAGLKIRVVPACSRRGSPLLIGVTCGRRS